MVVGAGSAGWFFGVKTFGGSQAFSVALKRVLTTLRSIGCRSTSSTAFGLGMSRTALMITLGLQGAGDVDAVAV